MKAHGSHGYIYMYYGLSYRPESSSVTPKGTAPSLGWLFIFVRVCIATNRIQYNTWSVNDLTEKCHVNINHRSWYEKIIFIYDNTKLSVTVTCMCFIRTCISFIAFHPSSTDNIGIYLCSPGSKSWSKISNVSFSYLIASKVMLMLFCKSKPKILLHVY